MVKAGALVTVHEENALSVIDCVQDAERERRGRTRGWVSVHFDLCHVRTAGPGV